MNNLKKIAIVSHHKYNNYGTMLQAYALAKAIADRGFDAEYISYQPFRPMGLLKRFIYLLSLLIRQPKLFFKKMIGAEENEWSYWNDSEFSSTVLEFNRFYETHVPHTSMHYNAATVRGALPQYVNFIVGSDQTWSPHLYDPNSEFFLDFLGNDKLKNAYAPSLGSTEVSEEFQDLLRDKLSCFNRLSCREKINCDLISKLTGKTVAHVLDPTLLLDQDEWRSVEESYDGITEPYILCYILGEKKCISEFAEKLGRLKKISVYYIVTRPCYLGKNNALTGVGPHHFLSLIRKAKYVCTDSFHGTVFCINFNRNFYSFTKHAGDDSSKDNARIKEVLGDFGLMNRYRDDGEFSSEDDIDFGKVNELMQTRRYESLLFLDSILRDEN